MIGGDGEIIKLGFESEIVEKINFDFHWICPLCRACVQGIYQASALVMINAAIIFDKWGQSKIKLAIWTTNASSYRVFNAKKAKESILLERR
ncbi:hypothetical protein MACH16_14240 [Marinomonas pontica]|uniref:Uncharacterized protein n=1 Tax=Marinomonas pontica TaxID=264739 RepID=A0ABM8FC62_9GAMM|nr:hypothetical protein MACH16_14240 [Marinomonas pontica]